MSEEKVKEFAILKKGKEVYRTSLSPMEEAGFGMAAGLMLDSEKNSEYTLVHYVDGKEDGRKPVSAKIVSTLMKIHDYDWEGSKTVKVNVVDKNTDEKEIK